MKVKNKLTLTIIAFIIFCSQLVGCFDYSEINKITFATSVIFDIDDLDNIYVYFDCVRPYRNENDSSDKGKRVVFEGKGKTALEAIKSINSHSNNKLNFSQIRAYIFTENAAVKGLDRYIDLINNNQQFGFKPYMFVYYGDINDIVDSDSEDDYLGIYLEQLQSANKDSISVINSNVNDYLVQSQNGSKNCFTGSIAMEDDIEGKKVLLSGGTLFHNNKLLERLSSYDALCYNLLNSTVKEGVLKVNNPINPDGFITLEIIKSKPHTHIEISSNDKIDIYKDIDLKVSLGDIQGELSITKDILDYITINEKIELQEYLHRFYNNYRDKNIDIIGAKRLVEEKYPSEVNRFNIKDSNIHISIDVDIEGSSLIKDSL